MEPSFQLTFSNFTPEVGLRGSYQLKAPFDSQVDPRVMFTCTSLVRISELIRDGVNVFADYYDANGLSENDYDADVALDRIIITIVSDGGVTVKFPTGYLLSYPNVNGEPYQITNLQINLPPFPRDYDYSNLTPLIQELIQRNLGVPQVVVKKVIASEQMLVSEETSKATMAKRRATAEISTPSVEAKMWRERYETLLKEHRALLNVFPRNIVS